jgi:hypothetical protein
MRALPRAIVRAMSPTSPPEALRAPARHTAGIA